MSSVQVAKQLDLKAEATSYPTYNFQKILPLNTNDITITSTGGQQSIFDVSPNVYNLSKSYLTMTLTPAAGGASNYNHLFADCLSTIQRLRLETVSGIQLCDYQNAQNISQLFASILTKASEMQSTDPMGVPSSAQWFEHGIPHTAAIDAEGGILNSQRPYRASSDNTKGIRFYSSPQQLYSGSAANSATPVLKLRVPFSAFFHSVLAVDKDLYFPETLRLIIDWSPSSKLGFVSTVAASAGAPSGGTTGAMTGSATISGLEAYMAWESNQVLANAVRSAVMSSGVNLPIDYVRVYVNQRTGTSQHVNLRFSRIDGSRLKRVYHTAWNGTENSDTAYDHSTSTEFSDKIQSFQTLVNNQPETNFVVNVATEDFQLMKPKLKECAIGQNVHAYMYHWFWSSFYDGTEKLCDIPPTEELRGMELSNEDVQWAIQATTASGTFTHYTVGVFQRTLSLSSAGVNML